MSAPQERRSDLPPRGQGHEAAPGPEFWLKDPPGWALCRAAVLHAAADKLDAQAAAHGESVVDYTDLLRVWADDDSRREDGT